MSPIQSVDRALRVLVCLAEYDGEGEQLGHIAARLGEDKASVHRALNALKHRFFAVQDPDTGNYALGPAALGIADTYISHDGMRPMLHRAMLTVCAQVNETLHAAIPEGRYVRYIDKVEPARSMRVGSYIGARYPMKNTALGRSILSVDCNTPEELGRVIGEDPGSLWPSISLANERGYAVEHEENEVGITCVSVPILFSGRAVASISISGPSSRMSNRLGEYARHIHSGLEKELTAGFSVRPIG